MPSTCFRLKEMVVSYSAGAILNGPLAACA